MLVLFSHILSPNPCSWDMQIFITKTLVSSIMQQLSLRSIQQRSGADSTPKPLFHPIFEFQPIKFRVMRFVQNNDSAVLRTRVSHLPVRPPPGAKHPGGWGSGLSLHSLLNGCNGKCPFQLHFLDLIGFDSIGMMPYAFWDALSPSKLHNLALHFGGKIKTMDYTGFWDESIRLDCGQLNCPRPYSSRSEGISYHPSLA